MSLLCEYCTSSFTTNAKLYMHKKTVHGNPSLVLVNHGHNNDATSGGKRKLGSNRGKNHPSNNQKPDPQLDPNLTVIDDYDAKRPKNDENDDGLKIIDEVNDEDDSDGDDQRDPGLTIVDRWDRAKDYRQLYKDCIREGKNAKIKFERQNGRLLSEHRTELDNRLEAQQADYDKQIKSLKNRHEKQLSDLEDVKDSLCKDELQKLQHELDSVKEKYETELARLKATIKGFVDDADDVIKKHKTELAEMEKNCQEKIKKLNDYIKSQQDDDDTDVNPLIKAIFNCTTMEEIFKIQRLVKTHQWDILVQDHLPTLQNLFFSLSYGIIPICQPQRDKVTDEQRSLVEEIQSASRSNAKKILFSKRNQVANLFSIINDSIKLARNSYNRYSVL